MIINSDLVFFADNTQEEIDCMPLFILSNTISAVRIFSDWWFPHNNVHPRIHVCCSWSPIPCPCWCLSEKMIAWLEFESPFWPAINQGLSCIHSSHVFMKDPSCQSNIVVESLIYSPVLFDGVLGSVALVVRLYIGVISQLYGEF